LTTLHEGVRRKRPEMWKNGWWILRHNNAPAHNTQSVKTFLAKHKIPILELPPYSPDLAPCNLFFSKD
jgi:transposase